MPELDSKQLITTLYVAALGRAPDSDGLKYWTGQMDSGFSFDDVIASFLQSDEGASLYRQSASDSDFFHNFYETVLNRAPDEAGAQYWEGRLSELGNRKDLIKEMIFSIRDSVGDDHQLLENKVEAGLSFAASESGNNTAYAKGILSVITSDPNSVTSAKLINNVWDLPSASQPSIPTVEVTPAFALHEDTGVSGSDGVTKNGLVDVALPGSATSWSYTVDGGDTWTIGSGANFELAEGIYGAGKVSVSYEKGGDTITLSPNEQAIVVDQTAPTFNAMGLGVIFTGSEPQFVIGFYYSENIFTSADHASFEVNVVGAPQSYTATVDTHVNSYLQIFAPADVPGNHITAIVPVGLVTDTAGNQSPAAPMDVTFPQFG